MSERSVKRGNINRLYRRATAAQMQKEGKSIKEIAEFLNVDKEIVPKLILEYERCNG